MKLKTKDVKWLLKKTYPDYTGRKFHLEFADTYHCADYWSEGSRKYVCAVVFDDNGNFEIKEATHFNPMTDQRAFAEIKLGSLPDNIMLVEHEYFCGKDLGISFIVKPNSPLVAKMISQQS